MAAARTDRYETKADVDDIEDLSKKLMQDLRKHIRALGPYPVFSERWAAMADSLARIANISEMERKLPKDKADATLWECEELALRYLLEDGKLNLCLRLLSQLHEVQLEVAAGARTVTAADAERMDKFERGLGVVLRNAWMHSEALQTTDLPLLVGLIGSTLKHAAGNTYTDSIAGKQSAIVLYYLLGLGRHLEAVGESRVMSLVLEHEAFLHAVAHLAKNHSALPAEDKAAAAEALALLVDSEEFGTHPDAYLPNTESRKQLVSLRASLLAPLVEDTDTRRKLRPLLDLITTTERDV